MYQFIHVEAYSRTSPKKKGRPSLRKGVSGSGTAREKWSLRDVMNEAERLPGACGHVESPEAPVVLYGMSADEFIQYVELQAEGAVNSVGAKLRADAAVAVAGVASFPIPARDLRNEPDAMEEYEAWEKMLLEFLKKEYGTRLKRVIRHTDEDYYHAHFYVAEERSMINTLGVLDIHPGRGAKERAKKRGADTKGVNASYKRAMKDFQDRYFIDVSKWCDHDRDGPRRVRLDRFDWRIHKVRSEQAKELERELKAMKKRLEREIDIIQAKTKAAIQDAELAERKRVTKSYEVELARLLAAYDSANERFEKERELRIQYQKESVEKDLLIAKLRADVRDDGGMSM